MPKMAAEVLIERLADWGVDTVFGLPGDGINGIMEGLRRQKDRVRFVLVHHEEAAAFMATAYAKTTGCLGVCLATSGPTEMHYAAGAEEAITINRYAHLVGGCRMAADERAGVVDANLRSFAVPNLFITDGSVMPTQGSDNPALTIMALARAADYLASGNRA